MEFPYFPRADFPKNSCRKGKEHEKNMNDSF